MAGPSLTRSYPTMTSPLLIRSGVANDRGRLRPTLGHTLEAALSISDVMIDELLERLERLRGAGRNGPVPGLAALDAVAVEQLCGRAEVLKHDWHTQLRQVLYHGQADPALAQVGVRFDDLHGLDEDQIHASIEAATAEQALHEPVADLLPRLNALVSNLMGWLSVQPSLNPLRPRAYAVALHTLLRRHLPDERQRRALAVPVAHIMGESLRQVYRELIQWLQAHDVEPLQPAEPLQGSVPTPTDAVGRTLLTLSRLRQLLAGDFAAADGSAPYLHTVPASMTALEDLNLIEPLMKRLRQRAQPAATATAETAAAPELPVISGQHIGRLLGQEVVRLMLEHLTHDERLLPPIRQQLGLLEPALVRLSQAEPRFFSDRLHPARQLLEAITQRSLGYQSLADEGFAELLASVSAAVQAIHRVTVVSEESFGRLLRRLRRRWEEDDARKLERRAEAARALLHAEQRQTLAERLADDWRQRLQGLDVAPFVQRFLLGPWAQAAAEDQLLPTEGGEPLGELTDELIWSAQPALIRRDLDRLARLVPRLVVQLRQGLARIGYPEARTAEFLDALVALHQKALDLPTLTEPPAAATPVADAAADVPTDDGPDGAGETAAAEEAAPAPETFWIAGQAAAEAGFVDAVSGPLPLEPLSPLALGTGAWVDLKVQGEWVRAQLTWTSPRGGLYMFISTQGLAHSMTQRTLDRLLGTDALRIVSSGGVVDHALDAVARQALRNSQDGEAAA